MSALYNLEPQPTAKVILHTSSGDLLLELFAKQTPLASRNFLQHCLDGYYTNTIFHRLVPSFIIQGGDPTGTGHGGVSALSDDGVQFEDEFHSRLKFNRRGLLGMANEGKDSNASQFFLTLAATPELQGTHTMFGRIEGDTIYNLMKMADAEMSEGEGSERPLYPTRVTGAEVLVNPFDGMQPRVREAPRTTSTNEKSKALKKRKKVAGKNVLSFGGDVGEDIELPTPKTKKAKANPKMISIETNDAAQIDGIAGEKPRKENSQRRNSQSPETMQPSQAPKVKVKPPVPRNHSPSLSPESLADTQRTTELERTNAEIAALKASMKRKVDTAPKETEIPVSALQAMIPASSTRGRKRGKATDESGALDVFKAFKQRLDNMPAVTEEDETTQTPSQPLATTESVQLDADVDDEADLCDLHFIADCQSCKAWTENDKPDHHTEADGVEDPGWMSHQLTFAKDLLGKDLEWKKKMEEIEVIDPREKARSIRDEGKRKARK